MDYIAWLWFLLEAAKLFFGVFLPFAVMYFLAVRGNDEAIRPLLVSTFLGCWIGQLVIGGIDKYLTVIYSGFFDLFYLSLTSVWEIFASLFSITLFVSLTAILLTLRLQRKNTGPTLTRPHSES